jgi:predicted XRE-type DNA-binding protein
MQCAFNGCERDAVSKSYCDKHYRRLLKRGNVNDHGSRKVDDGNAIERFHQKYKIDASGCWLWIGGTRPNSKGVQYPRHWSDDQKSIGAHRFSFELVHGAIPKSMYVCHKCDTPLCVNPDHLFIGTHHDNMRDMVQKKRSFTGRGENKKGRAKLTDQQANQIRKMEISQSKIAAMFGVSQTTIGRIKRQESY